MALPPELSDDQRKAALEKAGEARRVRADLKEQLKQGTIGFADVITMAEGDEIVAKTKVLTILESLPGLGKVKARRLMESIGISESRRVRGLGEQQRRGLLDAVT